MRNILRHLSSFIAPFVMGGVLPAIIVWSEHRAVTRPALNPVSLLTVLGGVIALAGLALLILTIRMFIRISQGTIMPWDPSRRQITTSLYSYLRNPMILSILILRIGEAVLFASTGIGILAGLFYKKEMAIIMLWMPLPRM